MSTVKFYSDSIEEELELDSRLAHGILRKVGLPTATVFTLEPDQLEIFDNKLVDAMIDVNESNDGAQKIASSNARLREIGHSLMKLHTALSSMRTLVYRCRMCGASLSWEKRS